MQCFIMYMSSVGTIHFLILHQKDFSENALGKAVEITIRNKTLLHGLQLIKH